MKRTAIAMRTLLGKIAAQVGLEGAFLVGGTAAMAVGASYLSPAGPWLVVGAVAILAGLALALPRRES